MNKIVIIDEDLCIGCAKCVDLCPKKILHIDEGSNKCKVTDESKCDKLGGCERVCPVEAIKIQGKNESKTRYHLYSRNGTGGNL